MMGVSLSTGNPGVSTYMGNATPTLQHVSVKCHFLDRYPHLYLLVHLAETHRNALHINPAAVTGARHGSAGKTGKMAGSHMRPPGDPAGSCSCYYWPKQDSLPLLLCASHGRPWVLTTVGGFTRQTWRYSFTTTALSEAGLDPDESCHLLFDDPVSSCC